MKRGELYRVRNPAGDPKRSRVFVIVSRSVLIDSAYSTVICAPVYSAFDGLSTQVPLGAEDGLKHDCAISCDNLVSVSKSLLHNFVGTLSPLKLAALDEALLVALELPR
jgi:mRNA interferase MazF